MKTNKATLRSRRILPLAVSIAALLKTGVPAQAVTYYWDGNDGTAGFGTATGTWAATTAGTTTSGWSTDATGATVVNGNSVTTANTSSTVDALNFGTSTLGLASGTISVGTVNAGDITFGSATGAITLSGGTINLTGASTITVNNATDTIGSSLVGAATSFTKAGSGTLVLTGSNSYGGTTIISGGTLTLNRATGSLSTSSALTFSGTGVFNMDNVGASGNLSQTLGALTFSAGQGTVQITRTAAFDQALTFNSLAARTNGASGNFVNTGGTNSATNGFVISTSPPTAGTLIDRGIYFNGSSYATYDSNGFIRAYGSGDTNYVATNTTIANDSTKNVQLTGAITGQGTASANTINMGANSITMTGASPVLSTNGILSSGSSTATISGGTTPGLQTATAGSDLVIRVDGNSDVLTVSSAIASNGGSRLTKSGAGTLILTVANTYTGITAINSGTLQLGNGGTTGSIGNSASIVNNGSLVLNTTGTFTIPVISGTGSVTNSGVILTLNSGNTFSGGFTLNSGSVAAITGTYTGFGTGKVTWTGGTLNITGTASIANNFDLNGATLNTQGTSTVTFGGAVTLKQNITFVNVSSTNDNAMVFNGSIGESGGSFGLTLSTGGSSGGFTFNAVNTFTGGINVIAANTATKARTLTIGGSGSLNSGNYAGNITNGNGTGSINYSSSADQILSGVITSANTLIKDTSSTSKLTLSGGASNAITGLTTVNAGTLELNKSGAFTAIQSGGLTINTGGTVQYNASAGTNQIGDASVVTVAGGTFNMNSKSDTLGSLVYQSGTISNVVNPLTLANATATALSMRNTSIGFDVALSSVTTSGVGVTFDATNNGTATISGGLNLNSSATAAITRTFTVNNGSAAVDMDITGVISNTTSTALTITGAGTLQFSGSSSNTYAGLTTVGTGQPTLLLNKSGATTNAIGAGGLSVVSATVRYASTAGSDQIADGAAVTLANGGGVATLDLNGISDTIGSLTFGGASGATNSQGIVQTGAGTLTLNGNLFYTSTGQGGVTHSISGNLSLGTATRTFQIQNNTNAIDFDITAAISGSPGVGIIKTAGGTVQFAGGGINTYTGLTDIQAGTILYGGNNVIADTASVKVSGGTLDISTFNDTVAGVQLTSGTISGTSGVLTSTSAYDMQAGTVSAILGGSVGLNKTTTGTVFLNGVNTYSGATAITGGTLGGSGTIAGTVTVNVGGTISPGVTSTPATLTLSNGTGSALTFNGNSYLSIDVASNTSADQIAVTGGSGGVVVNGINTVLLNLPGAAVAATGGSPLNLITSSAQTGSGSFVFANGQTTLGNASLAFSGGNLQLSVAAGGLNNSVWSGATGTWDSGTNWTRNGTANQAFVSGDFVTFDDTGTTLTVTSAGTVAPTLVTVNNTTKAYTINATIGDNGLSKTALVKTGTNKLTLGSNTNAYTGGTILSAGTLVASVSGTGLSSTTLGTGGLTLNDGTTLSLAASGTTDASAQDVNFGNNTTVNGNVIISADRASGAGSNKTMLLGTLSIGANTLTATTTLGTFNSAANAGYIVGFGATTASGAATFTNTVMTTGGLRLASLTLANSVAANSTTTISFSPIASTTFTITGAVTNNSGDNTKALALSKTGAGTLTLSGTNTFTGGVVINAGILAVSGTLPLNGSITLNGGSLGGSSNSPVNAITNAALNGSTITASTGTSVFAIETGNTITSAITVSPGATLNIGSRLGGSAVGVSGAVTGGGTLDAGSNNQNQAITTTLTNAGGFSGNVQFSNAQGSGSQTLNVNSIADVGLVTTTAATVNTSTFALDASATADLTFNTRQFQMLGSTGNTLAIGNNSTRVFTINTNLDATTASGTKTLTLTGTGTNINAFNGTITIGGLTTFNLTKTGANATWVLTGSNTYNGKTTISAGTLSINSIQNAGSSTANALGTPAAGANSIIDLAATGALRYTGTGHSSDRVINLTTAAGGTFTLDASGSGSLALSGGVTNAGTSATSTLTLTGTGTGSQSGVITNGTGTNVAAITKTNIGSWTLSGANTLTTGTTTLQDGGSLTLDYSTNNNSKIGATGVLTLGIATSVGQTVVGGGTLTLSGGSFAQNVASTSLNSGGTNITRPSGPGNNSTLNLGTITYGGGSNRGGSLWISGDNIVTTNLSNSATSGIMGGNFVVGKNWAVSAASASNTLVTGLTSYTALPLSTATTTSTNYLLTTGQSQGQAADLAVGSIKIAPSSDNQTMALNARNLTPFTVSNASGLIYDGGSSTQYTYNITGNAGVAISASNANSDMFYFVYDGTLNMSVKPTAGSGGLYKVGNGTLVLNANWSGGTGIFAVSEGTLRLMHANAFGQSTVGIKVQNGAALEFGSNIALNANPASIVGSGVSSNGALRNLTGITSSYAGAITIGVGGARINSDSGGSLTLTGGVTTSLFNDVTFGGAGNTTVSTAAIAGAGNLIKDGTGTTTLSATNTYSGTTTVSTGTLQLGSGSGTGALTGTTGITNNANLTINRNNSFTQASELGAGVAITGTGTLTQAGTGTTTLTNASNSYGGKTMVKAGTLSFSAGNASATANQQLGTNTDLDLGDTNSSATLTYTGGTGTLAKNINALGSGSGILNTIQNGGTGLLTLSGNLNKTGTVLQIQGGSNGITVSGVIQGTNGSYNSDLIINGGTTTLTNANTYEGPTSIINGGTLNANAANALPTTNGRSAVFIDQNVSGTNTGTGSSRLALGASQSIASLSGQSTSTVNLNSNTLTIGFGTTPNTSGFANANFAGSISGAGNIIKGDTSRQILSGSNGYTGTTTVNGGTLEVTGSLSGTTAVTVNTGGTLLLNNNANNIVNSATPATLSVSGGTVALGSSVSSSVSGKTQTFSSLTLSGTTVLDFGSGTLGNALLFNTLSSFSGTLAIWNWSQGAYTGGTDNGSLGDGQDRLLFGSTIGGNASSITFYSDSGTTLLGIGTEVSFGSQFEIVPVPEPATTALIGAVALCGLIGYRERRRFTAKGRGSK